ncbi:MAG: ribonuclease E/G [Butyrivibrio sp.]|nr:ribonuclease E/G [Butyrivibrio sp.]
MKKLVITKYNNKTVSMLFNENKENRIELYDAEKSNIINNIYVGRVRDVVANIGAAFVEIAPKVVCFFSLADNRNPIFLNRKNSNAVCQGDLILVQIKKEGTDTKAPLCSCNISLNGLYLCLTGENTGHVGISKKITNKNRCEELRSMLLPMVNKHFGFILRTESKEADNEDILAEANALCDEYFDMIKTAATRTAFSLIRQSESPLYADALSCKLEPGDEIVTDVKEVYDYFLMTPLKNLTRLYEDDWTLCKAYDIEGRIEKALDKKVWLPSGGYLIIEPTEALTVIDVNTGKFSRNLKAKDDTVYRTNVEACREIARQLILRNISGIIIVDFINMTGKDYIIEVERVMKEYLDKDYVKCNVLGYTKLGLMEITRKKIKRPLRDLLKE